MAQLKLRKRIQNLVDQTQHTVTSTPRRLMDASRGALHMPREEAERLAARGEDLFQKLVERGEEVDWIQMGWLNARRKDLQVQGREQLQVAGDQLEEQVRRFLDALHIPHLDDLVHLDAELDRINQRLDMALMDAGRLSLPIDGYEEMTVKEVKPLIQELDRTQLQLLKSFEEANANRVTLLREIDQRLENLN